MGGGGGARGDARGKLLAGIKDSEIVYNFLLRHKFYIQFHFRLNTTFVPHNVLKSSKHCIITVDTVNLFTNENIYFENYYNEQRKFTNDSYSI